MAIEWVYLVVITVILGSFATGITAMILKARARERLHRERMLLAEKGMDIPRELYTAEANQPSDPEATRESLRVIGTALAVVGIFPIVIVALNAGLSRAANGAGLFVIGIGILLASRMIGRRNTPSGEK
ncbi:MAG: hypothetical protein HXY20_07680 [Acidobacteria bacterium]|nr:hypothetical protein [Acidobacteriota bacterium]